MKVILLQDVKSLGKKGEVVNVNDGYARNFILPKKLGVEANGKNMNDLKLQKQNQEKVAQENLEAAQELAKKLEAGKVEVAIKTGEGGKTFGSVSSKEIAPVRSHRRRRCAAPPPCGWCRPSGRRLRHFSRSRWAGWGRPARR